MHNVPFVERHLREALMIGSNIKEGKIEARMWLKCNNPAGLLASLEVQPLTINLIAGQPAVLPPDRATAPSDEPFLAPIELKGALCVQHWGHLRHF